MKEAILNQTASKRQFLKGLTGLLGATAVAQFATPSALASALTYQPSTNSAAKAGKLFTQAHMQILHDICAVVLPETDSPSAAQLDVHGFIDHQLAVIYTKQEQQAGIAIVKRIEQLAQQQYNKGFIELNAGEQVTLLQALEAKKFGVTDSDLAQFKGLKSLLVFGYFTTEVGATEVLTYQAVPGGFKGSIPYQSIGKDYGSLAYY